MLRVGDEQLRVDEFCLFLFSWLTSSVTPPQSGLSCDNLDGREFIRRLRREGFGPGDAMMNLPRTRPPWSSWMRSLEISDCHQTVASSANFQWFVSAHSQPPWVICHTRPLPTCQPLRISDDMSRSVAELGNQKASTSCCEGAHDR
jgi:hypothetical protein